MMDKVPVIDLKPLINESALKYSDDLKMSTKLLDIGTEIRDALNQVGFFYFINPGIPQDLLDSVFANGRIFFGLPNEVKDAYKKDSSNVMDVRTYFGYNRDGTEKLHPTEATWETRQSYDGLESFGRYPNNEIPGFQDALQNLFRHSKPLVKVVLRLLAISLDLEPDFFIRFSKHLDNPTEYVGLENVRINYYPPITQSTPTGSIRAAAHSDYNIMTFLFQDEGGSERARGMGIAPIPGSIVVVTGLVLQHWTKGFFRAAPHRVMIPQDENEARKARQSIVYFHGTDEDAVIHPIDIKVKSAAPTLEFSSEPMLVKTISMSPMLDTYKGYK